MQISPLALSAAAGVALQLVASLLLVAFVSFCVWRFSPLFRRAGEQHGERAAAPED